MRAGAESVQSTKKSSSSFCFGNKQLEPTTIYSLVSGLRWSYWLWQVAMVLLVVVGLGACCCSLGLWRELDTDSFSIRVSNNKTL